MLSPHEYDASYFDGGLQALRHTAGYDRYTRPDYIDVVMEYLNQSNALAGKKVLEIGCAKGFLTEALVDAGIDAYGIDVSSYAIETCNDERTDSSAKLRRPDLANRFYVGDVLNGALDQFSKNEFDYLISMRFLTSVPEENIPQMLADFSRVSRQQAHVVDTYDNHESYTSKTLDEWIALGWPKNTWVAAWGKMHKGLRK